MHRSFFVLYLSKRVKNILYLAIFVVYSDISNLIFNSFVFNQKEKYRLSILSVKYLLKMSNVSEKNNANVDK